MVSALEENAILFWLFCAWVAKARRKPQPLLRAFLTSVDIEDGSGQLVCSPSATE